VPLKGVEIYQDEDLKAAKRLGIADIGGSV